MGTTTIALGEETKDDLAGLKRGGESFDDLVRDLVEAARAERPRGSMVHRCGRDGHGEWDPLEHGDRCPECRAEEGEPAGDRVRLSLIKKFEAGGAPYEELVSQYRGRIATLRLLEREGFEPVGPGNDPVLHFERGEPGG